MEKWYVAQSKPRNEELLWKQLCLRRIQSYYPCFAAQPANPRARRVQPYFPGYLFVYIDLDMTGRSVVEWIPGGAGLVSFGDEPAPVSEILIAALKQQIASLDAALDERPFPFRPGDAVAIQDGIFRGYEGIFDVRLSGRDRARVLLSLLSGRQIPVELSASSLQRMN
ncbi:MAG: hypothetical protein M5U11_14200 [Anaerolineales bacterium]|jgi:transcriptional antiterminator RfaH|nr:hypothetical protein [Anaerolineales bacterium]OQY85714.1 MAG: hypothetical protein B6D40_02725 [Anaerolineae bacterium UTCFX3]GER79798.1 transcription elongation factor/antiterminator RfaH [Candidatus Denitrolinea symbiosum]MCZ2288342.1 hypothetical protein [Anaerolineales bacterium]MCZ7550281.1 hypothetical protein [Anaerolineales bacterium]